MPHQEIYITMFLHLKAKLSSFDSSNIPPRTRSNDSNISINYEKRWKQFCNFSIRNWEGIRFATKNNIIEKVQLKGWKN